eukprot:m.213920 g.213920  ORF g.213920 m.213920 type:complete len:66 (+) comp15529_c0_seq3:1859-2056(+)
MHVGGPIVGVRETRRRLCEIARACFVSFFLCGQVTGHYSGHSSRTTCNHVENIDATDAKCVLDPL